VPGPVLHYFGVTSVTPQVVSRQAVITGPFTARMLSTPLVFKAAAFEI
jgi:hypothetical protein